MNKISKKDTSKSHVLLYEIFEIHRELPTFTILQLLRDGAINEGKLEETYEYF